jgi:hypothetical protein
MLTKINKDNMEPIVGAITGLPNAAQNPMTTQLPMPSNMQGGRQQSFMPQNQQQVGQQMFGGVQARQGAMPNPPLFQMDPNYNGEPGVQQEDFEQF